jgi:uncharacterized protein (DUF488 family)
MAQPFYTIGHATRPLDQFVELLRSVEIDLVADVRTVPRSRTNPQYNGDALPGSLAASGIGYQHITALGGLRGRVRETPREVNAFWDNDSFHNYADYAMGERFRDGLKQLRALGQDRRCAIMCAETVWWRCHRRIIADYLLAAGECVFHILGPGRIEPAALNEAARVRGEGILIYPADRPAQHDLFDRPT